MAYLVKQLLDLFELFWSEFSWVHALDLLSEIGKVGRVRARRERKRFELDRHVLVADFMVVRCFVRTRERRCWFESSRLIYRRRPDVPDSVPNYCHHKKRSLAVIIVSYPAL